MREKCVNEKSTNAGVPSSFGCSPSKVAKSPPCFKSAARGWSAGADL